MSMRPPASCSTCFSACIAQRISQAPVSAWRSSSASSSVTAAVSGPKPRSITARRFISQRKVPPLMLDERADILLVEDNPDDIELTLNAFKTANLANAVHVARDGVEALDFLFGTGPHAGRSIQDKPR